MTEQRRQILEMLAENKITADEAEQLIAAVEGERQASPREAAPQAGPRRKYLRVLASDDSAGAGTGHVNIRVPLQLLRAGVRLTSFIPPQAIAKINAELGKSGVPIDLSELKPAQIEELIDHLDELVVDVVDETSSVRVFCE
ncbi:hypothetical protein Afil01_14220 [Actinorhabdospora filicis]|uniref:YvlB/LiaX N-terminal domain-containing protein n=1 Tax=Actinorhabdospora filicis TaxID=1785913 RepID=A0A9W6SGB0_9ACTN|nr:hypothetical protein Afil01_14220 [Actinorhabdospora filicis]